MWQNVNVPDMDSMENSTTRERIHFQIISCYDEVKDFDNSEVG